jgi:glycosyltransferase involved in cell wall biosynthesis
MMRIAVFHNLWAGGAKRALYEQVRGLVARGHTLDVFTLSTADERFLPLQPVASSYQVEPVDLPQPLNTRWLPLALQYLNLNRRLGQLEALERAQERLAERIDEKGYDLVYVHHDYLAKSPYLLRYLRTPSVYYCQEPLRRYYECPPDPDLPPSRGLKSKVRELWYGPVEPAFMKRHKQADFENARSADLILANSYYSREAIYRAYGRFAKVAPLGVDAELFHPRPEIAPERAVVYVGRFEPNKDQALLIEAVGRLPKEQRPRVLLLGESTGAAPYRDGLKTLAAEREVELELSEDVDDDALVTAYNRALFAVYTPIMEPFGFVPLEAAACGKPCVGVREGGVRETILDGRTGLLVDREIGAVAAGIGRMLAEDEERCAMGERALAHVRENWTWQRSVELLEARFLELVGG